MKSNLTTEDKQKLRVIHIAENKIELNKQTQLVEGYKLSNISPISMSIPNLVDTTENENMIIVNIERVLMMVGETATATEMQNNFGKYLSIVAAGKEVIVTKNGKEVARLIPRCC